jgi:hypothetical protein
MTGAASAWDDWMEGLFIIVTSVSATEDRRPCAIWQAIRRSIRRIVSALSPE